MPRGVALSTGDFVPQNPTILGLADECRGLHCCAGQSTKGDHLELCRFGGQRRAGRAAIPGDGKTAGKTGFCGLLS